MSILITIVFSLMHSMPQISQNISLIDSCAKNGMLAMEKKQYSEAINIFGNCLEMDNGNPQIYFHRGTCYLLMHKPNLALVDFNQSLRLDSNIFEAYYNRGLAQEALSNFTFAESDFLLYKARVPKDIKVIYNLALLMEEMLDYPAAVKYYSLYLEKSPDNIQIMKKRALALAESDSVIAAIQDIDRCLSFNPNDSSLWMCKGNIYYDDMQFSKSIDAYNVVLLNYPGNKNALLNRADAYTANQQYDEAIRDYLSLSSADKYNPDYYFNIGFCYLQLSRNQDAILSFGKAMDTDYENLGLLLTLRGVAYNNLKMQAEACADWQHAIEAGYKEAGNYKINYCK